MHLFWLLLAFLLILLNAFFVAAEFGLVKLRQTKLTDIKKQYGLRGKILAQVHEKLDAYLSACQLGITLASLGLGWIGEPAIAHLLEPVFYFFRVTSAETIKVISFILGFSILSFLHIVIGELMPKSLAIRQSEKISVWTATPLYCFYWLMYPVIWLLNSCAIFLLRLLGLDSVHHGEHFYSTEEIHLILAASHFHGELSKEETKILKGTLDIGDLSVTDVMRPIEDLIKLEINNSIEENLTIISSNRYSRYPVFDKKIDQMIGLIHVKDLFTALNKQQKITGLREFLRPIAKISHKLSALELLQQFRKSTNHFALIFNSFHNQIGFITFDDLIQVLLGHVQDEFHKTQEDWRVNKDGSVSVKGNCSIYSLEKIINKEVSLEYGEDIETLLGLIIAKTGALPKTGETIEFSDFNVLVEKMAKTKILRARIYPLVKN